MRARFLNFIKANENDFYGFFNFVCKKEKKLCVTGDLLEFYKEYVKKHDIKNGDLVELIRVCQESVTISDSIYLDVREKISLTKFYHVNLVEQITEEINVEGYLIVKEHFVDSDNRNGMFTLNFEPFYNSSPAVRDTKSIGRGVEYLNRYLSSQMFNDADKWKEMLFNFLHIHKHNGEPLILNDRIEDAEHLNDNIDKAVLFLKEYDKSAPYKKVKHKLQELGFEKGLGKDVKELVKSFQVLDDVLNSPDHQVLAEFLSRIPMIFNIAIISPHGFFSQTSPMGLPDTGGQVVYILDQVKALEKALIESLEASGLDDVQPKIVILTRLIPNARGTDCNKKTEKIFNTKNSWIVRVPFKEHNKNVTDNWISRFEIWPYLEEFAEDGYIELLAAFGGRPDLIIGNYSDGNLVSYLLSKRYQITQCCIAHALEKSKYLYSALYWKDLEPFYHFSMQFTADLIAINSANFLITSSYQEIAGTEEAMGQYESYRSFTMPGLYRVVDGVNPRHTKFNIVSPGVNEDVFFPPDSKKERIKEIKNYIHELFFENVEQDDVFGKLEDPRKTPIFAMSRLDKIKNITGLLRWFGKSKVLQDKANLIFAAGKIDKDKSDDIEEQEQITLLHNYIEKYNLQNKIRWIGRPLKKDEAGEAYRIIAEDKGVFVQPALFEGFGLTVIEAMTTGIPVFATCYGGPLEIIEHRENGFHINPANDDESISLLEEVISKINEDKDKIWQDISQKAIQRVKEKYNWPLYTRKLLSQAKIYGFWKYATDMESEGMKSYLDIIYHTVFKPHAKKLLEEHNKR